MSHNDSASPSTAAPLPSLSQIKSSTTSPHVNSPSIIPHTQNHAATISSQNQPNIISQQQMQNANTIGGVLQNGEIPIDNSANISWKSLNKSQFYWNMTLVSLGTRVIIYPISLVKTRLQTQGEELSRQGNRWNTQQQQQQGIGSQRHLQHQEASHHQKTHHSNKPASQQHYNSTRHAFRTILRQEGPLGLYRGFMTFSIGILPYQIVYVTVLEWGKERVTNFLDRRHKEDSSSAPYSFMGLSADSIGSMSAGCLASMAGILVSTPIDVITQRLMIQRTLSGSSSTMEAGVQRAATRQGALDIAMDITKTSGIKGLWRGTGASLVSYAPSSALFWFFYDASKRVVLSTWQKFLAENYRRQSSLAETLLLSSLCGAAAGAGEAAATNILDVSKTRLQTTAGDLGQYNTMARVLRRMIQEEGLVATWKRGITARMLSHSITAAVLVFSYEGVKHMSSGGPATMNETV